MQSFSQIVRERYTTKQFDASKKIAPELFAQIEDILQYTPTSTNLQPLHFVIADDENGKQRIAKSAQGFYEFNLNKIAQASHVIVLCSKAFADDEHLAAVLEQEDKDGRYASAEAKQNYQAARRTFLNFHRFDWKDEAHWHAKQAYIALGGLLLGAAALGIDATPIEGVDLPKLDAEFNLREKGYTAQVVVALGYRSDNDFNAQLPKSRLPKDYVISKA